MDLQNSTQKQVAYAVLKWLRKHEDGSPEVERTSRCLSRYFDLDLANADCKNACDVGLDLDDAANAVVTRNQHNSALQERRLKEFITVLKQKGYFAGVEEGTPAYFERYEKAKEKFNARSNPYEGLTADQLKTHGNQKMVAGQYQEALNYYTKAIEMDGTCSIYYANRAAAYTHLKQYRRAVADCEAALQIDPNYSKAFSRLGTALFYEGDYPRAVENYARALELEPDNASYQADLKAAEEKIREVEANLTPAPNAFNFSSMANMLNNPEFLAMAQNVMQQPQFADMINKVTAELGAGLPPGGMPDFSQMFASLAAQQPADGSIPEEIKTPFGTIRREQLEGLQHMPEIKGNPKFHAIIDAVKLGGPMAILHHMNDPEVLATMTKLASSLFAGGFGAETEAEPTALLA